MAGTQAQNDWVMAVLGLEAGVAAGEAAADGAPDAGGRVICSSAKAIWTKASAQADGRIAALQAALRASEDEDYQAIAELGLNAVTGNHRARLMAALMEVDQVQERPAPAVIAGLRKTIGGFIEHLSTDPRVDAVDTNELGVSVRVAGTLIPALQEMDGALRNWR